MIARVGVDLRRDGLRAAIRGAVRRKAEALASQALGRAEQEARPVEPDENLTAIRRVDGLSRDV